MTATQPDDKGRRYPTAAWKEQRQLDEQYQYVDGFDFATFVDNSTFVFAKTMPWHPHEYTVRHKTAWNPTGDDAWFLSAVMYVRRNGYRGQFGKTRYLYLDHDGWHYWTMGATLNTPAGNRHTIILNRARGTVADGTMAPQLELG